MPSEAISSNIVSLLLFVSPGFLTIALIGKFYGVVIHMEKFEKTIWSLLASVPIGILYFYLNEIQTIDSFFECFVSNPLWSMIEIIAFSLLLAIISSLMLRYKILESISSKLLYRNSDIVQSDHSVWDQFIYENLMSPVIAKTNDIEYKGWLFRSSLRNEKREIVLHNPVIVYTDENGDSKDYPCGNQIILFGEDIKSITSIGKEITIPEEGA